MAIVRASCSPSAESPWEFRSPMTFSPTTSGRPPRISNQLAGTGVEIPQFPPCPLQCLQEHRPTARTRLSWSKTAALPSEEGRASGDVQESFPLLRWMREMVACFAVSCCFPLSSRTQTRGQRYKMREIGGLEQQASCRICGFTFTDNTTAQTPPFPHKQDCLIPALL